jgi:hypothetical protein
MRGMPLPPDNGACKGKPVEWFFPSRNKGHSRADLALFEANTSKAIACCNTCPVIDKCLDYSLEWEPIGIWGGHTETERHFIRRDRKIQLMRDGNVTIEGHSRRSRISGRTRD